MVDDFRLKNSMILKIFRTFISAYILSNLTNFNNLEFLEATSLETNLPIVLQTLYQCQHGLSLLEQISTSSGSTKHEPCFFFFGRMINLQFKQPIVHLHPIYSLLLTTILLTCQKIVCCSVNNVWKILTLSQESF